MGADSKDAGIDELIARGYGDALYTANETLELSTVLDPEDLDEALFAHPLKTKHQATKTSSLDYQIRCGGLVGDRANPGQKKLCGKLLAEYAGWPWYFICPRCKSKVKSKGGHDRIG